MLTPAGRKIGDFAQIRSTIALPATLSARRALVLPFHRYVGLNFAPGPVIISGGFAVSADQFSGCWSPSPVTKAGRCVWCRNKFAVSTGNTNQCCFPQLLAHQFCFQNCLNRSLKKQACNSSASRTSAVTWIRYMTDTGLAKNMSALATARAPLSVERYRLWGQNP